MSKGKNRPKKGIRPPIEGNELFSKTGDNSMSDLILDRPTEESLAETVRSIFDWFKPRLEALLPDHAQRNDTPRPRFLTPDEAAKVMRVNPQTVMKWCRQQKMGVKAGRKWLISQEEVDRYLRGVLFTKGPKGN
jgi:excisionase family DNA binding protein